MASALTLRPYQEHAVAGVEQQWLAGVRTTLLVLATGLGKTVIAAELIRRCVAKGGRVLFIAHRGELLDQALKKLELAGIRAALEKADARASLAESVVVASVQSLQGDRLARFPTDQFSLLVVDEAHHAPAAQYRRILERFPWCRVVGLTATAVRADGRSLGKIFATKAYEMGLIAGIEGGWLVPLVARRVWVEALDLRNVAKRMGDFELRELDRVCSQGAVIRGTCWPLVQLAGNRKTIVFAVSVQHAEQMASVLRSLGRTALAVAGTASAEERAHVLHQFSTGQIQYLVNCSLFFEGFDEPTIECVAIARPTMSAGLYTQMVGRGTRLSPGKTECLLLCFTGASRHGLCSPIDALASNHPQLDELREEMEQLLLGRALDVSQAMRQLEGEATKRLTQAEVLVTAAFRSSQIDPYLGAYLATETPASGPPLDERYRRALYDVLGIANPPAGLSNAEAQRWLAAARARRDEGYCSVKQARKLAVYGLDTSRMTFDRAMQLTAQLAAHGWNPIAVRYEPERRK